MVGTLIKPSILFQIAIISDERNSVEVKKACALNFLIMHMPIFA